MHVFVEQDVAKDAFTRENLGGTQVIFGYTVDEEELNTKCWIVYAKRQDQEEQTS